MVTKPADSMLQAIGNTPVVRLNKVVPAFIPPLLDKFIKTTVLPNLGK